MEGKEGETEENATAAQDDYDISPQPSTSLPDVTSASENKGLWSTMTKMLRIDSPKKPESDCAEAKCPHRKFFRRQSDMFASSTKEDNSRRHRYSFGNLFRHPPEPMPTYSGHDEGAGLRTQTLGRFLRFGSPGSKALYAKKYPGAAETSSEEGRKKSIASLFKFKKEVPSGSTPPTNTDATAEKTEYLPAPDESPNPTEFKEINLDPGDNEEMIPLDTLTNKP